MFEEENETNAWLIYLNVSISLGSRYKISKWLQMADSHMHRRACAYFPLGNNNAISIIIRISQLLENMQNSTTFSMGVRKESADHHRYTHIDDNWTNNNAYGAATKRLNGRSDCQPETRRNEKQKLRKRRRKYLWVSERASARLNYSSNFQV